VGRARPKLVVSVSWAIVELTPLLLERARGRLVPVVVTITGVLTGAFLAGGDGLPLARSDPGLALFSGSLRRPSPASTSTAAEHRTIEHSSPSVQETAADRDLIACTCPTPAYLLITFRIR